MDVVHIHDAGQFNHDIVRPKRGVRPREDSARVVGFNDIGVAAVLEPINQSGSGVDEAAARVVTAVEL